MIIRKLFLLLACVSLSACTQFQENVKSNRYDSTPAGLSEKQEQQVNEFAEAGQLNSFEQEAMNSSIEGQ
tara:strand:- start:3562 stop:3771 length:210 start_codon:yes stop_codon:yes gene_type:complete